MGWRRREGGHRQRGSGQARDEMREEGETMLETMMNVLEALADGEAPSALSIQIHVRSREQHAAYLGTLTSLLGQWVDFRQEVYRWHEWRQGELLIVLHEPHEPHSAGARPEGEMATEKKTERCVLVTTAHRGVFFGVLASEESHVEVVLTKARNVISWSGHRGFLGLASHGPELDSRIGSTAERIRLYDVTSITDCTAEAVASFRCWPEP